MIEKFNSSLLINSEDDTLKLSNVDKMFDNLLQEPDAIYLLDDSEAPTRNIALEDKGSCLTKM